MGDKLNRPAVEKVLNPFVSRTDYLSAPARLHGNTLFILHKQSDPDVLSRIEQQGFCY